MGLDHPSDNSDPQCHMDSCFHQERTWGLEISKKRVHLFYSSILKGLALSFGSSFL